MDTDRLEAALDGSTWSKLKPAERFAVGWRAWGYAGSDICREHAFHAERRWRFDFAWPSAMVAVEVNGFGYGHQAQQQQAVDAEKLRAAVLDGWAVLAFTTRCLGSKAKVHDAVVAVCELLSRRHGKVVWNESTHRPPSV